MSARELAEALLAKCEAAAAALNALPAGCKLTFGFSVEAPREVVEEISRLRGVAVDPPFEMPSLVLTGLRLLLGNVEVSIGYFEQVVRETPHLAVLP